MKNGAEVWNEMRQETKEAEELLLMEPGTVEAAVRVLEKCSPRDIVDLRDILDELGFNDWKNPAEDFPGVLMERRRVRDAMGKFGVEEAAREFIERTARLPERERIGIWTQGFHYARKGMWEKFPEPLAEWFPQMIGYLDHGGSEARLLAGGYAVMNGAGGCRNHGGNPAGRRSNSRRPRNRPGSAATKSMRPRRCGTG